MSKDLRFSKSPLTEAVIDIRVEPRDGLELETLADMQRGHEEKYPTRQNRMYLQGEFSTDPESPPAVGNRSQIGYNFVSADGHQIIQAKLDGFTFNRLTPYETWAKFSIEARRWWDIYREVAQPKSVTRLAVRYINRLDLPLPLEDLTNYLKTVPEISSDLPQGLSAYFMQLQIPYEDIKATLILNQTLVQPPNPNVASIVLDIDLFRVIDVPLNEREMWDYFEQLRQAKNNIFLACITDKTKELIA